MLWEVLAALLLGAATLWLVLMPLVRPEPLRPATYEPEDPLETRRGQSLVALKELDFDREMGKLSDDDYAALRAAYTREALAALRDDDGDTDGGSNDDAAQDAAERLIAAHASRAAGSAATSGVARASAECARCGPRPEADARFCSACGGTIGAAACRSCGAGLRPDGRFCERCGAAAAAA